MTDLLLQSWFEDIGIKFLAVVFHHSHLKYFFIRRSVLLILLVKHLHPVGYVPYILAYLFARTQAAAPLDRSMRATDKMPRHIKHMHYGKMHNAVFYGK